MMLSGQTLPGRHMKGSDDMNEKELAKESDLLKGCIDRMSAETDVKRLSGMYAGALVHLCAIYNHHCNRLISEGEKQHG